jgi:hypothetical protein
MTYVQQKLSCTIKFYEYLNYKQVAFSQLLNSNPLILNISRTLSLNKAANSISPLLFILVFTEVG